MENSITNSNVSILPLPLMLPGQPHQKLGENEGEIPENSRQCPICHAYYKYGNSYWQHVRYVHASFLIQCVICEKCYKRTTMAKHHILHSHKIAWHLCGNYIRRIKKSDLTLRPKTSIEKKTANLKYFRKKTLHLISCFNCYNCPESFTSIQELFEHVKCHKNEVIYEEEDDNDEEEEEEEEKEKVEKEESELNQEDENKEVENQLSDGEKTKNDEYPQEEHESNNVEESSENTEEVQVEEDNIEEKAEPKREEMSDQDSQDSQKMETEET